MLTPVTGSRHVHSSCAVALAQLLQQHLLHDLLLLDDERTQDAAAGENGGRTRNVNNNTSSERGAHGQQPGGHNTAAQPGHAAVNSPVAHAAGAARTTVGTADGALALGQALVGGGAHALQLHRHDTSRRTRARNIMSLAAQHEGLGETLVPGWHTTTARTPCRVLWQSPQAAPLQDLVM